MDQKKQDLNPELKSIYDKVMNTQVKSAAPAAPVTLGEAPTGQSAPTPPAPAAPVQPLPAQPAQPAATPNLQPAASVDPAAGGQTYTSPAPTPSAGPQAFVFNGNKVVTPTTQKSGMLSGGAMSGKIVIVLVIVLVVAWGALWAKIFGIF